MRTLFDVFEEDLSSKQKNSLLASLAQRWEITETNVRKTIKNDRFKSTTLDIGFMYDFHAIGFDPKKGFFLDLDRLKEIKEFGAPIPQLYGLSL